MKITTLIPAYKTEYIGDLLHSLRFQTAPAHQIIISDDSPHGEFREVLYSEPHRALVSSLTIEFHEGPRDGAPANLQHLLKVWGGRSELVHVMLDDDVVYPEFYQRHQMAHASGDLSCSVSRRWMANEAGRPLQGQPLPDAIAHNANRMILLNDDVIFMSAVGGCNNWLGEFSNAVFRADCCELLKDTRIADVSYAGLWDIGVFAAASMRRPLCHIQDHLGYFRVSASQNSSKMDSPLMKGAHLGWIALAVGGHRAGRLSQALVQQCCSIIGPAIERRYAEQPDVAPICALLPDLISGQAGAQDKFIEAWNAFLATHKL